MKTKKLLALLMAGAMSVSVLSGCGGSAAKTDDSSADAADTSASAESDVDYVKSNGKLVIGITDFAPMDYKEDGSDEWVGFDADMAKAFAESLGVKAEFIEINWDNKSVREFDVVTLDRVKKIDIEEDFGVWKEYAYRRGIHGAILSYLEIRREHFYRVETTADGLQFVTARGWEDLSELMQVYESLGIPVDRQVVEQYLQLPQVASDFANYLQLYDKYKQVYRVDELLSGTWEPVRASELRDAPFDEKLGVLGLLLSRLADGARDAYRLDALTDALHADLLAIREGEKAIASLPDEKRAALADKRNGGSSDKDALYVASREVERLDAYRQTLMLEKVPEDQQFDRLKALFSADVDARAAAADKTDAELANAFAFLDAAIPDSQELVLFATELTANWFTSWFIQNFGCDAYFAHNKRLLFDDTQKQLLQDIESARNEES